MKKKSKRLFLPLMAIAVSIFGAFTPIANVSAADVEVSNFAELVAALNDSTVGKVIVSGDIVLEDDVTFNKTVRVESGTIINLNDQTITINSTMAIYGDTEITGDGEITSDIENPIGVVEGDLTINNGLFTSGENTYAFIITYPGYSSNIYINDGVFDISNIIINNYGSGEVIISGGTFVSEGIYAEQEYADAAFMTSDTGTLEINGEVIIDSRYRFLGEKFADEEEKRGEVICTKGIIYEATDWDDDWNEIDYDITTVCGEEETLEEDTTIDGTGTIVMINTSLTIPAGKKLINENGVILIVGEGSTVTICGEYEGDEDTLVEDGGTIVYDCEEEPIPVEEMSNPGTFDTIHYLVAVTAICGAGLFTGLLAASKRRG